MTSDKQNPGHIAKPFTPALSAAFHRSNKAPLTPRLASPGGYRTPRRVAQSEHPASTNTTPSKDDYHPTPSYLNTNVTPRTNSRASRRDGPVSSPTSTPSGIPSAPQTPYSQSGVAPGSQNGGHYRTERSPVRAGAKLEPPRTSRARTLTAESHHSARPMSSPDMSSPGSPMFFHASDARASNTPDPEPRLKPPGKPSSPASFIYANGKEERRSSADETYPAIPAIKRRSTGLSRSVVGAKTPTTSSASPRLKSSKPAADSAPRLSDSVASQSGPPHLNDSTEHGSQRQASLPANVPDRPPPVPLPITHLVKHKVT